MSARRRKNEPAFKAKIALTALNEEATTSADSRPKRLISAPTEGWSLTASRASPIATTSAGTS
jgi:hypothetical protein